MPKDQMEPHWSHGSRRCLLWDATVPDTLAPSHVKKSAEAADSAAASAESVKAQKYASLATAHDFVPVVLETLGTWGTLGPTFVDELGKRITAFDGDPRATSFLKQRLALAVQQGNAAAVLGTLPTLEDVQD